ncbi:MAG: hypothetical protein ACJ8AS_13445 [Hyphomicrobiales bacterium]
MLNLIKIVLKLLPMKRVKPNSLPPLPTFRSGGDLVDVANRDELYAAMEDSDQNRST